MHQKETFQIQPHTRMDHMDLDIYMTCSWLHKSNQRITDLSIHFSACGTMRRRMMMSVICLTKSQQLSCRSHWRQVAQRALSWISSSPDLRSTFMVPRLFISCGGRDSWRLGDVHTMSSEPSAMACIWIPRTVHQHFVSLVPSDEHNKFKIITHKIQKDLLTQMRFPLSDHFPIEISTFFAFLLTSTFWSPSSELPAPSTPSSFTSWLRLPCKRCWPNWLWRILG